MTAAPNIHITRRSTTINTSKFVPRPRHRSGGPLAIGWVQWEVIDEDLKPRIVRSIVRSQYQKVIYPADMLQDTEACPLWFLHCQCWCCDPLQPASNHRHSWRSCKRQSDLLCAPCYASRRCSEFGRLKAVRIVPKTASLPCSPSPTLCKTCASTWGLSVSAHFSRRENWMEGASRWSASCERSALGNVRSAIAVQAFS